MPYKLKKIILWNFLECKHEAFGSAYVAPQSIASNDKPIEVKRIHPNIDVTRDKDLFSFQNVVGYYFHEWPLMLILNRWMAVCYISSYHGLTFAVAQQTPRACCFPSHFFWHHFAQRVKLGSDMFDRRRVIMAKADGTIHPHPRMGTGIRVVVANSRCAGLWRLFSGNGWTWDWSPDRLDPLIPRIVKLFCGRIWEVYTLVPSFN